MAQKLQPQENSLYGTPVGLSVQNPPPINSTRSPTGADTGYRIGQMWVNRSSDLVYILTHVLAGSANWALATAGTGDVAFIDGDSGQATPVNGVIVIAGGTNIDTSAATDTVTISLEDAITVLTSVASDTFTTTNTSQGLTITDQSITADGTDANIDIDITCKGAASEVFITGGLTVEATNPPGISVHNHVGGQEAQLNVINFETDAAASPHLHLNAATASVADVIAEWSITDGQAYTWAIDNSTASDNFLLSRDTSPGTNPVLSFDGASDAATFTGTVDAPNMTVTATNGTLHLSGGGSHISIQAAAVTDFAQTAVPLTNGVLTVANTNIGADDFILATRRSVNSSTVLGDLTYTISAGVSFTITSVQRADPSMTETNDDSLVDYLIIRPTS